MSTTPPVVKAPWRLAIRSEGEYVNAYFADLDTMDGAILLGSIKRNIAEAGMFDSWRLLMQESLAVMVQHAIGERPEYDEPQAAPEHERAGRA